MAKDSKHIAPVSYDLGFSISKEMFKDDAIGVLDDSLRKIFFANLRTIFFAGFTKAEKEFPNWVSQEPTFTQPVWGANFAEETKAPV